MKNNDKELFDKLVRNFVHHRGAGGNNEHAEVDEWDSGFMTPEMLASLKNSLGNLKFIPDDTNVRTLGAGNYIVWTKDISQSNLPSTGGFVLEVKSWNKEKFKLIRAYHLYECREYVFSTNTDGGANGVYDGWVKNPLEKTLFNKAFAVKKGSVIELESSLNKFEEVVVTFRHNKQNDGVAVLPVYNLKKYGNSFSVTNISGSLDGVMVAELFLKSNEAGTEIRVGDFLAVKLFANSVYNTTGTDSIEILKVVGRL